MADLPANNNGPLNFAVLSPEQHEQWLNMLTHSERVNHTVGKHYQTLKKCPYTDQE